jgi:hypothetical protein
VTTENIDELINKLEALWAKTTAADGALTLHERCPDSPAQGFEILGPTGGILFRSTSYGKMEEDAGYLVAAANGVPALCQAIRILRRAFLESCQMTDRAQAKTECADSFLEAVIATVERDMQALGLVLVSHPDTPLARAKKYLENRKKQASPVGLVKGP